MTAVDFPSSLFSDPSRAQRNLQTVHEMFITSGCQYPVEEFSLALHKHLTSSPDPDTAVTNLLRFSEATLSKASLFNDLLKYPVTMEVLLKVFGFSPYLSDILVRDPELFRWLTASDVLMIPQSKSALLSEVQRIEKTFVKPERRLDALRRLYRREVLRIGAKDILGNADLRTVTRELSDLADTLIDASCRLAQAALHEKYGSVADTRYAVIGLGKLGGAELNYSSDIDIIFAYENEGNLTSSKGVTYHEYFNKFVERVVQNLSQASGEGHLYRVDTRLRPESGMGPLARSVQSYLLYYESRGELWERQMLIKARPVAGDLEFGGKFLKQLVPFIYPRTFFANPTGSISRIKSRIEAAVGEDDNIKLQSGGIRDIEFIVQALQLLNGGRNESVRCGGTLDAIEALRNEKLLSPEEHVILVEAYEFFRTLEHRLQTILNTQTHTVPSDRREQAALARRLGLRSEDELLPLIDRHRKAVRRIFESVLNVDRTRVTVSGIETVIEGATGEAEIGSLLTEYGFRNPQSASRTISSLISGSSLLQGNSFDGRARNTFREVAPALFRSMSETPSSDIALNNFSMLLASSKFPDQLLASLKEDSFRKLVFSVCGTSTRLTRGLTKDSLLLELLATNSATLGGSWDGRKPRGVSLIELKQREELRSCIRYVLGVCTFGELTRELTRLADGILESVVMRELKMERIARSPLAVFAVGKYGTRELSVDADLDVIFIADLRTKSATDKLEKVASRAIQTLSTIDEQGRLYEIDARLRPEGRNAPLVVDRHAYAKYLAERASLWERQSLTRLRFVCGDNKLAQDVEKDVAVFVYETPLPKNWTEEIVAMRRKMETRSHTRAADFLDVKLGPGGMVDIEFIAQMIQLKYASTIPSLRHLCTTEALGLAPGNVLSGDEACVLETAYQLFRRVELMMRLVLEDRSTILPEGEKLELLARTLGLADGDGLWAQVSDASRNVRGKFLQVAGRLSSS